MANISGTLLVSFDYIMMKKLCQNFSVFMSLLGAICKNLLLSVSKNFGGKKQLR